MNQLHLIFYCVQGISAISTGYEFNVVEMRCIYLWLLYKITNGVNLWKGIINMRESKLNILDVFFNFIEKYYYVFLMITLSLTLFNLFYYLQSTPIYSWDEARHGISAYEMLKKHEYIVNTYGYLNDYWNLKPPMSFWAIMLGYKLAGCNPFGLRVFSAIAALLTMLIAAAFVKHKHGGVASLITVLILTTSPKYIVIHSARTGDADSLFVLFFTIAMISMILIEENIKFLYLAGLGFSFAFLTKSWHALNIILIGFIYLLVTKILFKLKVKEWIVFIISSFFPILIWGILRYMKDGFEFFRMMINYDLLARTSRTLEGHIGDRWYYFDNLKLYYGVWLLLLGFTIAIYLILHIDILFKKRFNAKDKNYIVGMALWILVPLSLYSKAETKIPWYILPLFIPIPICIGGVCGSLLRGVRRNAIVQLVVITFLIQGVATYEPAIIGHIVKFSNDNTRVSFNKCEVLRDITGTNAYIYYGAEAKINVGPISEFKDWQQSDLLSVEYYWDLIPKDGGFYGFLNDKSNSILIVPKKDIFNRVIEENNLKVISKSNSIYILSKK